MDKINEKVKAIQIAESCIHSVLSVRPDSVSDDVLRMLAELKLDLADIEFEQRDFL